MSTTPNVIVESGKFRLEYGVSGTVLAVRPIGAIDEDMNFGVLLNLIRDLGKSVTMIQFDLGMVTSLNSCGVREWLLFMERVLPTGLRCVYVNVGELFVDQANMIANLFGRRDNPVLSFQAPYHCTTCNAEATVLLDPNEVKFKPEGPVAPASKCPRCGAMMTFDSLEDEYFGFIRRLKEGFHVD